SATIATRIGTPFLVLRAIFEAAKERSASLCLGARLPSHSSSPFLRQDNFDVMMIFHREEKSIEQGTCQKTSVLQAESIDEGREPTASVGEIHEFVKIAEMQDRLESLDLADDEAKAFQNANNLFAVGGVADHVIHGQAAATP